VRLIDTHCHLAHDRLAGRTDEVLARAESAGVCAIICAAGNLSESAAAAALACRKRRVFCMAGVHPHDAKDLAEGDLERIEALAGAEGNVALGEVGLDYHYDFSPRPVQRQVFAAQLALARRLDRPVVVHTREAFDETLAILAESGIDGRRVVFHSFTGDAAQARRALDTGAAIGFSGIATFKNAGYLRQAARLVPDDRILVETDAPYLAPEPVRKMRTNEPANVAHVVACLAGVRGVSAEALAELTAANAARFFSLDMAV